MRIRWRFWPAAVAIAILSFFVACSNNADLDTKTTQKIAPVANELNIWWEQGYNLEEDEAFRHIVARWQKQTGNKVKLSFFTNDELIDKVERANRADRLPDLMMSLKANRMLYPRLAWEDKLADVRDIIEPIKDDYSLETLQAITYINAKQAKRSYYGIPLYQDIALIFYWQSLLASIGLTPQDIPQDWDAFWQFWQQAQTELKTKRGRDIYGLGFSLAQDSRADDTSHLFEQILEAKGIDILNDRQLQIDRPKIRQGIIESLKWYAKLYRQGYIPPDAVEWSNADNNRHLLNRSILMTPNNSLSIPATVKQDSKTYYNRLGVVEFPNQSNGKPMRYLLSVRQAAIFKKDGTPESLAKQFLRYFIQPQVTLDCLKAANARHQPVQKSVWQDRFWQDTQDPYVAAVTKIITQKQIRLPNEVYHPAYSQILAENVWGQAITQVTAEQISPEAAAERAIARIKEIFAEWDKNY